MYKLSLYIRLGRIARRKGHSIDQHGLRNQSYAAAFRQGWLQADAELRQPNVFKLARFKHSTLADYIANARHRCIMLHYPQPDTYQFLGYR